MQIRIFLRNKNKMNINLDIYIHFCYTDKHIFYRSDEIKMERQYTTKEEIQGRNQKRSRKSKKKKRIGSKIFIFVLILLIIGGIIIAKRLNDLDGNWAALLMGHNKNTLQNLDRLNVLVMGESQGMSDTMIVCSYDPKTQEASMLSIPRDTFIGDSKQNASAYDKINSLYNNGRNPQKTIDAINELTGLNIQHYIVIDTKALVELVDAIDGVYFNVPMDMKYNDEGQDLYIDLKEGWQTLDGDQVEQLVRFRHNANGSTYSYEYGIEDLGRMRTQREVVIAIAKQTIQLKNVKEIGKIVDITEKYVKTNIDFDTLKDYIPYAMYMNTDNIRAEQLPGGPKYINGISFFLSDEEETDVLVEEMFK